MIGLPAETDSDREAIVDLCLRVWEKAKKTRSSVNISISTFVPKAMTPFQWSSQIPAARMEEHLQMFKARLKKPGLRLKWNQPGSSVWEAVFARGDRRLGGALRRAWESGARFDGWSDHFNQAVWERALAETGLDVGFYAERCRERDEILPWDHLSAGVSREYLWNEYEKARREEFTPDCRAGRCTPCGVCDHEKIAPLIHEEPVMELKGGNQPDGVVASGGEREFLYRVIYSRLGRARFFGQLETAAALERAIRRAGLPAAFTKGHHPHPKISFGEALPLGMETLVAEAYVALSENIDCAQVRERLDRQCNGVMKISSVSRVDKKPASGQPCRAVYHVSGLNPFVLRHLLDAWVKCGDDELTKKTKRGETTTRLGRILLDVRKTGEGSLEMDIYEAPAVCFRPMAILQHLAGARAPNLEDCLICKIASYRLEVREENDNVRRTHH
jgi:radical SAM-linked protein